MPRPRLAVLAFAMLAIATTTTLASPNIAAGGGGCAAPVTDGRGTSIDLEANCMVTTILRIDPGDTVTFTNRDQIDHTVTGAGVRSGDGKSFGTFEAILPGATFTHAFETNGVYVYYCAFHPGMVGAIVVGDGTGPGAATGDGVAAAGVTQRTTSDIAAASGAPAASHAPEQRGASYVWLAVIAVLAAAVTAVVFIGFGRVRSLRFRHLES